jgi:hypothetical protein
MPSSLAVLLMLSLVWANEPDQPKETTTQLSPIDPPPPSDPAGTQTSEPAPTAAATNPEGSTETPPRP